MAILTIPLELAEIDPGSYHIFIPATLNRIDCDILIDTGASRTVFDLEYFNATDDGDPAQDIISSGVGPGQLETRVGQLSELTLGGHTWQNLEVMFMDLSHINELYQKVSVKRIAGLIGGDFLFKTKAHINYRSCTFRFSIPAPRKSLFI